MSIIDALIELRHELRPVPLSHTHTDLAQARDALSYWEQRRRTLPWYRCAQRRAARDMADRWRDRIRVVEHQHLGRGALGQLAVLVGASAARTLLPRALVGLVIIGLLLVVAAGGLLTLWVQIIAVISL